MKVKKIGDTQEPEEIKITEEKPKAIVYESKTNDGKNETSKTKYYIIGGVLLLIIASLLYYIFVFLSSDKNVITSVPQQNNNITKNKTEINKEEVTDFINKWASYQSNRQVSDYVSVYDPSFSGIKRTKTGNTYNLNYSQWISDRSTMYQKAKYVTVTCKNLSINILSGNTAEATFNQIYLSDTYNDEGTKILKLKKNDDGKILITNEELIYSTSLGD